MKHKSQVKKAETFLSLHHDPKLLVLPNIWDPLGARLLESMGYPAVATASAAVAYSRGYDDGENISFAEMLDVIRRIVDSVDIPVTADIERGYGNTPDEVAKNVHKIIEAGAVGINIEDSTLEEGGPLRPTEEQGERIRAVRQISERDSVPLVINARVDVFIRKGDSPLPEKIMETIERANAYIDAGADCIYPIVASDPETLKKLHTAIEASINVYASPKTPAMQELEDMGIARLSLGPGLIRASVTTMKQVAGELLKYGSYDSFLKGTLTSDEIQEIL